MRLVERNKIFVIVFVCFCCLIIGTATIFASYSSEIKTASKPGYVSQSGSDPLTWSDVSATTTDVSSNKRLFYSNNPEEIPLIKQPSGDVLSNEGIIFNSAYRSDGGRVYMHHYNNSPSSNVTVALLARNVGSSSGSLTIGKFGDGAGATLSNPLSVGGTAAKQYFSNSPLNTTFSSIPVNGWVTVVSKTLTPGQTTSMIMDLTYSGTFRLYTAYVTPASSYATPLAFAQANYNSSSAYLWSNQESTVRGDALHTRQIDVSFNPDNLYNRRLRINNNYPNDSVISTSDYTWNVSSPTTRTLTGNFGLLYKVNVNTGTWATNSSTKQLYAGLNPRGGSMLGGVYSSVDIPNLAGGFSLPSIAAQTQTANIGRWGSYWRTANFEYILPGGANAPNMILFSGFTP
ncbi:hypothetical protein [Paenibacillus sp. HB172176]|uniref:hypothetical protein n=1 Tax=Paenibacillus sp. HB172176 TaxID=2493690 RepID=UPI00143BD5BC|nr:hypothetical protein [Paenibacillus sp. HB172176]